MRRKDREITDKCEILEIMRKCDSCFVSFIDEVYPYIVPLNFGVHLMEDQFVLYFHGANKGRKMELLEQNNHVGFSMDCSHQLITAETACEYTMEFESVCGNGIMSILSEQEKMQALTVLMNQYDKKESHSFDPKEMAAVAVLKLEVNQITGKRLKRG